MLGYKAPRLEGMKSTSPFRCLLVKLNCMKKQLDTGQRDCDNLRMCDGRIREWKKREKDMNEKRTKFSRG